MGTVFSARVCLNHDCVNFVSCSTDHMASINKRKIEFCNATYKIFDMVRHRDGIFDGVEGQV